MSKNKAVTVAIDEIRNPDEYYPRTNVDSQTVELYRQSLEQLPPVRLNKNMLLIDGAHRIEAHKREGADTIKAHIEDIPNEDVYKEAIKSNAIHGKQLTRKEKKRAGIKLYDAEKDNRDELIEILGVAGRTVRLWTQDIRKQRALEEEKEQNETILEMWLRGETQESIAENVNLAQSTIAERIIGLGKDANTDKKMKVYNVWKFSGIPTGQMKYPGQVPRGILDNLLYYYTDIGDIIYDPFGGGGVTVDSCKLMMRRYRVYDIDPKRDEIKKHDIVSDGIPEEAKDATLAFLDPPYWKQKRGDYGDEPTNLANMELDEFHNTLETIVNDCREFADYVALIISPTLHEWDVIDHIAEMIMRVGMPYRRISVPYNTQQYNGTQVNIAKEKKEMLVLNREILIWRNDDA